MSRFDELLRKMRLTTGSRFNACRRLVWHDRVSQWSVTFASVALIVVTILQVFALTPGLSSRVASALQLVLALFVLVFSLLLSQNNFAVRADRMHHCGMELNRLYQELETYRGKDGSDETYLRFVNEYDEILRRYENHATVDYELYTLRYRSDYYPQSSWIEYSAAWLKAHAAFLAGFLPHVALYAIIAGAFWFMAGSR